MQRCHTIGCFRSSHQNIQSAESEQSSLRTRYHSEFEHCSTRISLRTKQIFFVEVVKNRLKFPSQATKLCLWRKYVPGLIQFCLKYYLSSEIDEVVPICFRVSWIPFNLISWRCLRMQQLPKQTRHTLYPFLFIWFFRSGWRHKFCVETCVWLFSPLFRLHSQSSFPLSKGDGDSSLVWRFASPKVL